jgi:ATP-dependent RNA helicase DDX24/MAK5
VPVYNDAMGVYGDLNRQLEFRGKPKVVDLTSEEVMAGMLSEAAIACTDETRDQYLYYLLNRHPGQTIVFCNAISALRRVAALMKLLEIPTAALHANMQQRQRLKALDRFVSVRACACTCRERER